MKSKKRMDSLLAVAMLASAMCGRPYDGQGLHIPKSKGRPGTLVRCHVCGAAGGITLYNDGDGKICAKCREKKMKRCRGL